MDKHMTRKSHRPTRSRHGLRGLPALLAALVSLAACATPVADTPVISLTSTPWMLVSLAGTSVDTQARPATLVLEAGNERIHGHAGCNRLSGSYALDEGQLEFSRLITTKMACAQGMEQEQAFIAALAATATYRLEQGRLTLLNTDGDVLAVLMAEPSVG